MDAVVERTGVRDCNDYRTATRASGAVGRIETIELDEDRPSTCDPPEYCFDGLRKALSGAQSFIGLPDWNATSSDAVTTRDTRFPSGGERAR